MSGRKRRVEDTGTDTKVAEITKYLQEKIESEEWPHGYTIPSQKALAKQFDCSFQTARNAILAVAEEGMLHTGRGRRALVNWPNPQHPLFIDMRATALMEPDVQPIVFSVAAGTEAVSREWTEDDVEVSRWVARWLELEAKATMIRRTMTEVVDNVPILTSTSFLPADQTGGEGWQDVAVGQLALTGLAVTTTLVDDWTRMPRGDEFKSLKMRRGVPVLLVCRPCQIWTRPEAEPARAGVLIVARGDYVFIRHASADGRVAMPPNLS